MKYQIMEFDKELLLQSNLSYKIRILVTNASEHIIDVLYGVSDTGGVQIDANSNIRRTLSLTLKLDDFISDIENKIESWIGFYYEVDIGVLDNRTNEFIYYPNGRYRIVEASTVYDAVTNSLSLNLSDRMSELDGTRNGQIGGAPIISIPREKDGEKQQIREIVIKLLTDASDIKKYLIDDIGEFYGIEQDNPNGFIDYREKNKEWNVLPYDLEYSSGSNVGTILSDIRDLYPNCQMYFDVYKNFCFDMIPSLDLYFPDLDDDYLQQLIVAEGSESVSYDIASIKNVTEIFGRTYDVNRYSETCVYSENTHSITLKGYEDYNSLDIIGFIPVSDNGEQTKYIRINNVDEENNLVVSLPAIPLYFENTKDFITAETLEKGIMCVVKIDKIGTDFVAYYLGQYQPHALCVLTHNTEDTKYTKEYFSEKYNIEKRNIIFREEPFSPFSIQRIGEVLDSKSGNEFDNILSYSNAIENAKYYNRRSSSMFDTVTIKTKLIPWLDVNVKLNYKKAQEENTYSYIVTNRADDFMNGTTTITMYKFMQLYE